MYLKHYPNILKPLSRDLVFDIPGEDKNIYLTFDDGPHPEITPLVLETLEEFNAPSTFFLVGWRAQEYADLTRRIVSEGHAIGNHTHTHVSGWKTKDKDYFAEITRCAEHVKSRLFRPPYGQITRSQSKVLQSTYKIIMWSNLSADFDEKYSPDECFGFATKRVKAGNIIVFHDSEKAWPRLKEILSRCLEFYLENGFKPAPLVF